MQYTKVKGLTCLLSLLVLACSTNRVVGQNLQLAELTTVGVPSSSSFFSNTQATSPAISADVRNSHEYRIDNFDHILPETLGQRARVLMEQGLYADAEQTFAQALHAQRINHGLYSADQIPLLESLVETLLIQRKWEKLNQRLQYWEHLNLQANFESVGKFLNSLEKLSGLYIAAAASRGSSESAWYLVRAKSADWRAVTAIEKVYGKDDLRLPRWLYKIVLTHYYQSHLNQRRGMTSFEYKSDSPVLVPGWALMTREYRQQNYEVGLELLQRITDIYRRSDTAQTETEALMLVMQADWQLLYGEGQAALSTYQNAYQTLLNAAVPRVEVDQYFSQATVLPAQELSVSWDSARQQENNMSPSFVAWSQLYPGVHVPNEARYNIAPDAKAERATVSFTVEPKSGATKAFDSQLGKFGYAITNLKIIDHYPENAALVERAIEEIGSLQLRPFISNGNVLSSTDIGLNYVFAQN